MGREGRNSSALGRWVDRVEHLHGEACQPGRRVVIVVATPPSPALAGAPLPLSPTRSTPPWQYHTDGLLSHRHNNSSTDIMTYTHLTAPPHAGPSCRRRRLSLPSPYRFLPTLTPGTSTPNSWLIVGKLARRVILVTIIVAKTFAAFFFPFFSFS